HLLRVSLVDEDQPFRRMEVIVVGDDRLLLFKKADGRTGQHGRGGNHGDSEARQHEDVASGHGYLAGCYSLPTPSCCQSGQEREAVTSYRHRRRPYSSTTIPSGAHSSGMVAVGCSISSL